jgi:glycosyltransferase involved in cell wall biosynthesis
MDFAKSQICTEQGLIYFLGDGVGADADHSGPRMSLMRLQDLIACPEFRKGEPEKKAVYINGVFSPFWRWCFKKGRKVLAPRGMLSGPALQIKPLKKKIYLGLFTFFGMHRRVVFHVSSPAEEEDTYACFGENIMLRRIGNVPFREFKTNELVKESGRLNLISVAQIAPIKNLHLVADALQNVKGSIQWTIVGKVLDSKYLVLLKDAIKKVDAEIEVIIKGPCPFPEIRKLYSQNQVQILPSSSENFGHAHLEGLVLGLPLITSNFVPWLDLEKSKAGFNLGLNSEAITMQLQDFVDMDEMNFRPWAESATEYARSKIDESSLKADYSNLFFG